MYSSTKKTTMTKLVKPKPIEEEPRKNRPNASPLLQQELSAWQPIPTAGSLIPTVICIGIAFIPIGVALLVASNGVQEKFINYGWKCEMQPSCTISVNIPTDFQGEVFFYYYLDQFNQNNRRYMKSRNDDQYMGNLADVDTDCEPFLYNSEGTLIVPCGAIANSMFNDTFTLTGSNLLPVPFTTDGVLWDVDLKRFANPPGFDPANPCASFAGFAQPPNWQKPICDLPGALTNVDFIVWMRAASLPSFRKLWRKLDMSQPGFTSGLPAGDYTLTITNNFNVTSFNGDKAFVISTASWAGGRNTFLPILFLVVGAICILLGVAFIFIHHKFGHTMFELSNITNARYM